MRNACPSRCAGGFTYVIVLAAVAVLGIVAGATITLSSRATRVERETELLFRGQAYRNAIRSYYEAGLGTKTFPRRLDDLLRDPRFPARHHLRALYPDPMAGNGTGEWILVRAADGGISGVVSASKDEPLRQANFPVGLESFEAARSYTDWIFEYRPTGAVPVRPRSALNR